MDILFRPFGICSAGFWNHLAFQLFDFDRTRWRWFQKWVVHIEFDIYEFIIFRKESNVGFFFKYICHIHSRCIFNISNASFDNNRLKLINCLIKNVLTENYVVLHSCYRFNQTRVSRHILKSGCFRGHFVTTVRLSAYPAAIKTSSYDIAER